MRIVFMGTPEFAVATLDTLIKNNHNVVGVITAPDKYGRRGRKTLIESAVKNYALHNGLNILQPTNLKSKKFIEELSALKADLQIVVAFRMLPVVVWDMPPMGTYNLHGSLLPKYRGAAPINWAIIKGEKVTGVTTFKLKHEIDTGSIALQQEIPILESDNVADLHDRMMSIGADLMLETVKLIENGEIVLREQSSNEVTHAPKLRAENTKINFSDSTQRVHDFIRGLSPYPGAWTSLDGQKLKIFKAEKMQEQPTHSPGTILSDNKKELSIATSDGRISIIELQLSGKRRMKIEEFLNGYDLEDYSSIEN